MATKISDLKKRLDLTNLTLTLPERMKFDADTASKDPNHADIITLKQIGDQFKLDGDLIRARAAKETDAGKLAELGTLGTALANVRNAITAQEKGRATAFLTAVQDATAYGATPNERLGLTAPQAQAMTDVQINEWSDRQIRNIEPANEHLDAAARLGAPAIATLKTEITNAARELLAARHNAPSALSQQELTDLFTKLAIHTEGPLVALGIKVDDARLMVDADLKTLIDLKIADYRKQIDETERLHPTNPIYANIRGQLARIETSLNTTDLRRDALIPPLTPDQQTTLHAQLVAAKNGPFACLEISDLIVRGNDASLGTAIDARVKSLRKQLDITEKLRPQDKPMLDDMRAAITRAHDLVDNTAKRDAYKKHSAILEAAFGHKASSSPNNDTYFNVDPKIVRKKFGLGFSERNKVDDHVKQVEAAIAFIKAHDKDRFTAQELQDIERHIKRCAKDVKDWRTGGQPSTRLGFWEIVASPNKAVIGAGLATGFVVSALAIGSAAMLPALGVGAVGFYTVSTIFRLLRGR